MRNITNITIRQLTASDWAAVNRLAELESTGAPSGPMLGAEVEGTLLAAISVETGGILADPFIRTAEIRDLLELRVAQLRKREVPTHGRLLRRRSASAPAPAGQLLGLHPKAS